MNQRQRLSIHMIYSTLTTQIGTQGLCVAQHSYFAYSKAESFIDVTILHFSKGL